MKKKLIAIILSIFAIASCVFALTACDQDKDENDIIAESDWTAAFSAVENTTRYYQQCKAKCDPEHDFIVQCDTIIGYNSDEKQYYKTWQSSSDNFVTRYVWEKNGKHYCKQDVEEVYELQDYKWNNYTTFDVWEKPFLLSFCKDKFSQFRYYSVGLDTGDVEYKATDVEIVIYSDETSYIGGRGNIYVTFTKEKQIKEIRAFVNTSNNERWGFSITDIGTWDSSAFDEFTLPEIPA